VRRVTAIAVAVVLVGRHVLVGRRSVLAREGPGLDEFPGGKVEPGEPGEAAAVRECREETGLEVTVLRALHVAMGVASFGPIEVTFYLARPTAHLAQPTAWPADSPARHAGHPLPPVAAPFAWRTVETLGDLRFPETNRGVVPLLAELVEVGQGGS
jgi:8-oxo-dGTP pyrophosphatase MutT (NUDIX family)